MVDQRRSPLPEYLQFFLNEFKMIIGTFCPVPAHVVLYPAKHVPRRTGENEQRVHPGYFFHIARLAFMPRYTVQHEQIVPGESGAGQKQRDDLSRKRKMLILEKQSPLEHSPHKHEFCRRIGNVTTRSSPPQFSTEIQMMTPAAEQSVTRNGISERGLARAGWTEKKEGINRRGNASHVFNPFTGGFADIFL